MTIFKKAENTQAFAKVGILGFAGAGKTFTATTFAIGLVKLMQERKLEIGNRPAMFLDTETGSDWVQPNFAKAGIELHTAKTRAFKDLITAIDEAEQNGSVLLLDSISHFWRELCDSYQKKKNRPRLQFQDWAVLKSEWGRFTDKFINSNVHIVMCGRAGYEYDYFEEDGKKELQKTGIKMKAETETGYEPSLLILMEREMEMDTKNVFRTASVLKDRSDLLDGKQFRNPTFNDFLPHVEYLNLGGSQLGVDTSRNSDELFNSNGDNKWRHDAKRKDIALDEVIEVLNKHHGGQSAAAKEEKAKLLEKYAGTRSWTRITETFKADEAEKLRNDLWIQLEGAPYNFTPPVDPVVEQDVFQNERAA